MTSRCARREKTWRPPDRHGAEEDNPVYVQRKALAATLPHLQFPDDDRAYTKGIDTIVDDFTNNVAPVQDQILEQAAASPGGAVNTAMRHVRGALNLLGAGAGNPLAANLASTEFSRALIVLNQRTHTY